MSAFDLELSIAENLRLTERLYKISFESDRLSQALLPGQFIQVLVAESYDPLLRRPFSVYRVDDGLVEILYEVVGKGTGMLAEKQKGDRLKVMGPLGNTFSTNVKERQTVAVGGGVGIAPFLFLAQKAKVDYFLMGARTKEGLLPRPEWGDLWERARFSTDDGSYGQKGVITDCLKELINEVDDPRKLYLYVCGPRVMMKAVSDVAKQYGIDGEASVDERMACGVGACLGCIVETEGGTKTACKDGPVFSFEGLKL